MLQLVIDLSRIIIPTVGAMIVACLQAKKHVVLKYKGIEIKGISEKNIIKILEGMVEEDKDIKKEDTETKKKGKDTKKEKKAK